MGLNRRQRRAMTIAIVTLGCWSIPAIAQKPPAAPTGTRIQDGGARGARAAAAAAQLKPTFSLTVNQDDLYVSEVVTVTLNPVERIKAAPQLLFTVDFGDGEKRPVPAQSAQVQYQYRTAGKYVISASVAIRPEIRATFDALPTVGNTVGVTVRKTTFSATPALAAVGEPITFATPPRRGDARIRYRFTFTDDTDTGWIQDVQTTHAYKSPGEYNPRMEVGIFDDGANIRWDTSEPVPLRVVEVTLDAPPSLKSNEEGTFTVRFPFSDPELRYRVNFADGSTSEWDIRRSVRHAYAAARTYEPVGEIGRLTDAGVTRVAGSAPRSVAVTASPIVIPETPIVDRGDGGANWDWLPYVAIVLVAALLGYGAKQVFFVPRPTFTPHHGRADSQIESADGGVNLELEVRLHREVDAVQTTLSVPSGRLIVDSEIV